MVKLPVSLFTFANSEVKDLIHTSSSRVYVQGLSFVWGPQLKDVGRLLVVTPRRLGSSPVRNKIRRRLKAIFYEAGLYKKGFDVIVFVKQEALALSFIELQHIIVKTLG